MGMSKNTLDRSDISTYPVKLKYSASYASSSAINYGITLNRGVNGSFISDGNSFLVYKLAKQLYYNSYLTGSLNNTASAWNDNLQSTAAEGTFDNDFRYFPTASGDEITVMAIPRTVFGENISRKSLRISGATYNLIDDGNGNVIDTNNNNIHVGNILYNQGIIIITGNQSNSSDYNDILIPNSPTTTTTSTTSTTTTAAPTTTTTTTTSTTTTTTTTNLQAISVRLDTVITLCGTGAVVRYVDNGILSPGSVLYLADLTTPVTGFNYVVASTGGSIYNLGSVDGVIGSDTGNAC